MSLGLISVIMCCYNDAIFVVRALDSIYGQTISPERYEVIFINDGSSDETEEIVFPFRKHSNFRYLKNDLNIGLSRSCNRGLKEAQGEYIIRLDADDFFEATILAEMCLPLDQGETDFVYCDRYEILADCNERRYVSLEDFNIFNLIAIGTMMRRRNVQDIGGYRNVFWEEYDLYIRYLLKSDKPPYYIPRPLFNYSIRRGAMTADAVKVKEGWEELSRLWPQNTLQRFGRLPAKTRSER